ncbi:MAG: tetratricopeptide repeat protein, partial [Akkermansiaceae bacterium]|nr:tetratricopeptide repeat protein [Akkermansiaceae bacterium]
ALLSDRAIELGDYESAFEHLQSALDARADLSTYSRASHLLWLTGDLRKARWLMDQAIASGGGYPENTAWCRAELAVMELHAGAMIVAEQHAARALREAPANPRVLATMGKVRACQGRLDEAVALYRRSIASAPTHDALAALADLYLRQGRAADAEKAIQAVIDHHGAGGHSHGPGGATHHHATGNAQLARFLADHDRNLEQALREAQAAGKTSRSISCMDTLAWCYLKTGEIEMAVRTIRRALKWKTPDPHLYFHAGLIHEAAGNHQLARRHLDRAFALNPRFDPLRSPAALVVLNAPRNAGPRPSGITPR